MPRVLYVHHRPQPSGAVRSLALLIGALHRDWEVHALVPPGGAAEALEAAGAIVHVGRIPAFTHTWDVQYQGWRWLVLAREALSLPGHVRQLRRLLRRLRPEIVHLNDCVLVASAAVAARERRHVVWHLRSSLPNDGRDRRSRLVCRAIDTWSRAVIAIDADVARTYRLQLPIVVVPNPVDLQPCDPESLSVPAGRVRIGYFGYLRRQKGWPQLVEAMRMLVDAGAPVHAVIVGGGVRSGSAFRGVRAPLLRRLGVFDEEEELRAAVRHHGLTDRFSFVPFVRDPSPIYRALDIVVFPNQGAGLGRPVLEAAAHGKPVVASGSPDGAGLLVDGETGVLLREATPAALADALAKLVAEPHRREQLGRAAAVRASMLTPKRAAATIESIYATVCGAASAGANPPSRSA